MKVPEILIGAQTVAQKFARRQVLQDVSLQLRRGECQLLCGPNGSGKTTLLRILGGLDKPQRGEFYLADGRNGSWRQCQKALLASVMYLHQTPFMFEGTVRENLGYGLRRGQPEQRQRIDSALQWAQLEALAQSDAKSLSGGETQRVALARAWLRQPAVMLLDEPTANMDSDAVQRTLKLLQQLKSEGVALLIATHAPASFAALGDRVLQLDQGKLSAQFTQASATALRLQSAAAS